MTVFRIIFLIIAVLILFLLFCPFVVRIVYTDNIVLKCGYIFPFIKILPQKPKKEKKEKKKKKKSDDGKPKEKKKNPIVETVKEKGLDGLIQLLKAIVRILLKLVKTITDHLVISKFDVNAAVVGSDPADTAMKFGYACSAVYPLVSIIDNNVKKCNHNINITAGFEMPETKIHLDLKVRIIPVFVVIAAVSALFKAIGALVKFKNQ